MNVKKMGGQNDSLLAIDPCCKRRREDFGDELRWLHVNDRKMVNFYGTAKDVVKIECGKTIL